MPIVLSAKRTMLERCAATSLNSKLLAGQNDFFSKLCVDAVLTLDDDLVPATTPGFTHPIPLLPASDTKNFSRLIVLPRRALQRLDMIGIKKVQGGSTLDTFLVKGVRPRYLLSPFCACGVTAFALCS
jgi:T-complex protein 1 subunit eta